MNTIGLSVEPDTTVILDGSLDYADKLGEINKTQIIETCESTSSEVLQLEEKIKASKYSKKSTASQLYLPSVNVTASAYPYNWQNEKITDTTSNTPNWTVSLGVSLPLSSWIPGSSSKDSVAKIDDTIKTYELQLENTKKSVRTKVIEKIKNIEKARIIMRKQRQQEYRYKLMMDEINEKDQKIESFKRQCEKINDQKNKAKIKFQREKEEVVKKFNEIVKQNKEIDEETIKQLFPDDEELYNKIKEMREKQKKEDDKMENEDKNY